MRSTTVSRESHHAAAVPVIRRGQPLPSDIFVYYSLNIQLGIFYKPSINVIKAFDFDTVNPTSEYPPTVSTGDVPTTVILVVFNNDNNNKIKGTA